jgi:hypothetical protein
VQVGTKERPPPPPPPAPRPSGGGNDDNDDDNNNDDNDDNDDDNGGSGGGGNAPSADGLNWGALAQCESGGNPRAVNPSGRYFGLYQFSLPTWAVSAAPATRSTRRRPSRRTARRSSTTAVVPASGRPVAASSSPDENGPAGSQGADSSDSLSAPSRLLGPAEVRALAAALGVRPTKSLGQNFVIDANTVRRIVRTAGVTASDVVLEVGPGLGR